MYIMKLMSDEWNLACAKADKERQKLREKIVRYEIIGIKDVSYNKKAMEESNLYNLSTEKINLVEKDIVATLEYFDLQDVLSSKDKAESIISILDQLDVAESEYIICAVDTYGKLIDVEATIFYHPRNGEMGSFIDCAENDFRVLAESAYGNSTAFTITWNKYCAGFYGSGERIKQ